MLKTCQFVKSQSQLQSSHLVAWACAAIVGFHPPLQGRQKGWLTTLAMYHCDIFSPSLCVPPLRLFCRSCLADTLTLSSPDALRQTLRQWLDGVKALLFDPSPLPDHAPSHAPTPTVNSPTHSAGGSDEIGADLFVGLNDSAVRSASELVALCIEVGVANCLHGNGSLVGFLETFRSVLDAGRVRAALGRVSDWKERAEAWAWLAGGGVAQGLDALEPAAAVEVMRGGVAAGGDRVPTLLSR